MSDWVVVNSGEDRLMYKVDKNVVWVRVKVDGGEKWVVFEGGLKFKEMIEKGEEK